MGKAKLKDQYYLVKKVKEPFMIDALNINIIKKVGKNLEMLTSGVIKPEEIGVQISKNGRGISCTNDEYNLVRKLTEKEVEEKLKEMGLNYSNWQYYMSNSENSGSSHLSGPNGARLS